MKSMIKTKDRRYLLLGILILSLTFGVLAVWAAKAPLTSAVVTNGRISIASLNKVIQHLDGGLVDSIAVKDGEIVEQGQLLLSLHKTPLDISLQQVNEQWLELSANKERLIAERDDQPQLTFSKQLTTLAGSGFEATVLATQKQLFASRRAALKSQQDVLRQRIAQHKKQIHGAINLSTSLKKQLRLIDKDINAVEKLAVKNLASQSNARAIQVQRAEIEGDLAAQQADIASLKESIEETKFQILQTTADYQKEVIAEIRNIQSEQINLAAKRAELQDKLSRVEIRAPVSGKVKGFQVVTQGAVIAAGKPIMEIVPMEKSFDIHANISPMDIDVLYPGVNAEVRFAVFDGSQQFPALFAQLKDVSSDTYLSPEKNENYYKATLQLHQNSQLKLDELGLSLVSGMPVEIFIQTGKRTFLEYLIGPLKDMLARALNEA